MKNLKKSKLLESGLLWFGAGVSIAEIITGTYFAPLGFKNGLLAILLGHLIGFIFMFLVGYIGAKTNRSSMDSVKLSFGNKGANLFAILNVIQLFGWTAIMIYDGSLFANEIFSTQRFTWAILIGLLILFWIVLRGFEVKILSTIAMSLLFILTLVLSTIIFRGEAQVMASEAMSFGLAVELAAAMPLSWLPVIADYTKDTKSPLSTTLISCVVYCLVSTWMYVIGLGAALFTQESDIAKIMLNAGLGFSGFFIVILSTVTTTFLDAYSAGFSAQSIKEKFEPKKVAILTTIFSTILACLFPMDDITDFLYLIGSVFAPMAAILICDFYILKTSTTKDFDLKNIIIWIIGFGIYRFLMNKEFILGVTLLSIVIIIILSVIVNKVLKKL